MSTPRTCTTTSGTEAYQSHTDSSSISFKCCDGLSQVQEWLPSILSHALSKVLCTIPLSADQGTPACSATDNAQQSLAFDIWRIPHITTWQKKEYSTPRMVWLTEVTFFRLLVSSDLLPAHTLPAKPPSV